MTATTTLGAIRENMETILVGLTPTSADEAPFVRHRGNMDFREWAEEKKPADALRKFQIQRTGSQPPPTSSDVTTRVRTATLELVIAYPRIWPRFSDADQPDIGPIEDVIEQDQNQLDSRDGIGLDSYGTHVAGHHSTRITWSIEKTAKVLFSVGQIEVAYYEEV